MDKSDGQRKSRSGKAVVVTVGAGVGGWIGSGIGIAGAFGAVSGLLPLAVLGGYVAHRVHKAVTDEEKAAAKAETLKAARERLLAERTTPIPILKRPRKGRE